MERVVCLRFAARRPADGAEKVVSEESGMLDLSIHPGERRVRRIEATVWDRCW